MAARLVGLQRCSLLGTVLVDCLMCKSVAFRWALRPPGLAECENLCQKLQGVCVLRAAGCVVAAS